ncbi:uncharacterized protein BDZ99DRAFT_574736 [Mytilinidion resinicola]|uniref:Uncharacterized protein n=1 Tax=Mytilinidion resinicola TaxID=574789 RepID=A0A6A6Y8I0_9PEZI|nr:uncharacterized protein BDZ99DRAFT_574736 [Mytilinidion resinicola]KAF2805122.1 hypothetical protein BDZ99DRAFT_574736 [Mytilinidion resinicola]
MDTQPTPFGTRQPSQAPLTPTPADDFSTLPHSLPYDEAFENDLMHAILDPSSQALPPLSACEQLPDVPMPRLPIPLNSPHRIHPSRFPALRLTHPHGYHTGGLGPSPTVAAEYAENFIAVKGIAQPEELRRKVDEAIEERAREVVERMQKRKEALKENENTRKKIAALEASRRAEERVEERIRAGREEKRAKV